MRTVIFTSPALADLDHIHEYIARYSPRAADKLLAKLEGEVLQLAERPGLGHNRADVPDLRYHFRVVRPYVIAFTFDDQSLRVLRIMHGRQDIGGAIPDPK